MSQLYPFTDPAAASPRRIVSGAGCTVTDSEGNQFFDAVSALWCSPLGFNPPRLRDAMTRQMDDLAYYHSFMGRTPDVTEELARILGARLPGRLNHVLFGNGGSDAVDTAAKLVRYYQNARGKAGKTRIIARDGGYHGSGGVSAALTSMTYCHDGFDVPASAVLRTGRPHFAVDAEPGEGEVAFSKRRAQELETLIQTEDAGTIGAFIGEPAIGAGGVILPPDGYWAAIQEVLAKHDILLIADEIITGFGRTGEWFACETFGIDADMMTMAKQLTASVFPMSAVGMTDDVRDTIAQQAHELGTFGHGFTYGGHPVGAAVALETMAVYEEMDLPSHVKARGQIIANWLADIRGHNAVYDVRCIGMLGGVEMRGDTDLGDSIGQQIGQAAERRGVFFRIIGNVIAIAPPYIATEDDLNDVMRVLSESIREVCGG
ncbi:MAG: aminotransferase class III-fold pyridoxal phosphate-dependent enzyme [Paracoccaceae bacterium]